MTTYPNLSELRHAEVPSECECELGWQCDGCRTQGEYDEALDFYDQMDIDMGRQISQWAKGFE
jgi:pentatricopeptide repeat protein